MKKEPMPEITFIGPKIYFEELMEEGDTKLMGLGCKFYHRGRPYGAARVFTGEAPSEVVDYIKEQLIKEVTRFFEKNLMGNRWRWYYFKKLFKRRT
jgi:hypothetical protein